MGFSLKVLFFIEVNIFCDNFIVYSYNFVVIVFRIFVSGMLVVGIIFIFLGFR